MSITGAQTVPCVCGAPVEVTLANSVNAARHPHLRQLILERRFHRFECGVCARRLAFDMRFFYLDWDRRQFFCVEPRSELHRADACVELAKQEFQRTFSVGPELVQAVREEFLVRLCFGCEELREKLLCDEAKLNDLVLETVKCQVMASEPTLRDRGVLTLYLDAIDDGGALHFRPDLIAPAPDPGIVVVSRALYDQVAARYPEVLEHKSRLANGPHVSLLRLVDWPAPESPGATAVPRPLL